MVVDQIAQLKILDMARQYIEFNHKDGIVDVEKFVDLAELIVIDLGTTDFF